MTTVDVLVFAPHPDDAEMCCGGLLLLAKRVGRRIGIVDVTRGEASTRGSPEERQRETAAASKFLGVDARDNLGFPDGRLEDDQQLRTALVRMLRKYRPRTLCVPYWEDCHPDHAAVGQAGTYAAWLCGAPKYDSESAAGVASPDRPPYRPRRVLHYQNRYGLQPDLILDISAVSEDKLKLVSLYASQFGPRRAADAAGRADEPRTMLSSDVFFSWFNARHGEAGARIGVPFGEPYCMKTPVPLADVNALLD